MGTSRNLLVGPLDVTLQLKDAGAVTTSGAAQVSGAARVLNVGPAFLEGVMVVDFSALDVGGGDEGYEVRLQGSSDPTFATDVSILASVRAGAGTVTGESGSVGIGRRTTTFTNQSEDGKALPYLRAYHVVTGGAGGGSVNYSAFITKSPLHG